MVRAPFYDKSSGLKKGAWSVDEDSKLIAYIETHGHWNWRALPKYAGISRCGKSCRLRWKNYLRPGVKRGNYSQEEDDLIIKLHQEFGNKWSMIAARLPGRTDNEIKNHWHTIIKKNNMANQQNPTISSETRQTRDQIEVQEQSNHSDDASNSVHGQMLESLPLSPETDQTVLLSSEDSLAQAASSSETSSEFGQSTTGSAAGDFWSEPFIVEEDTDISSNYPAPYSGCCNWDPEGIIILSPLGSYSCVSLYDNIDHDMDLFYQVMPTFQDI